MNPEWWATARRYIAFLLAPLFALAAKKWGVDITDTAMLGIDVLAAIYVLASNWKEVQKHRTEQLAPPSSKEASQ